MSFNTVAQPANKVISQYLPPSEVQTFRTAFLNKLWACQHWYQVATVSMCWSHDEKCITPAIAYYVFICLCT